MDLCGARGCRLCVGDVALCSGFSPRAETGDLDAGGTVGVGRRWFAGHVRRDETSEKRYVQGERR